jgi:hypothetical protein
MKTRRQNKMVTGGQLKRQSLWWTESSTAATAGEEPGDAASDAMEEPDFRSSPPAPSVLDQKDDRWQMPDIAPPSLAAVLKRGLDASAGAASSAVCTRRRSDAPSASDVRRAGDALCEYF